MNNQTSADDIDLFVDSLVKEKGFGTLDSEILAQIKADLRVRVEDRVNSAVVINMPDAKRVEFDAILATGDKARIADFARTSIPELPAILTAELTAFSQKYLQP